MKLTSSLISSFDNVEKKRIKKEYRHFKLQDADIEFYWRLLWNSITAILIMHVMKSFKYKETLFMFLLNSSASSQHTSISFWSLHSSIFWVYETFLAVYLGQHEIGNIHHVKLLFLNIAGYRQGIRHICNGDYPQPSFYEAFEQITNVTLQQIIWAKMFAN